MALIGHIFRTHVRLIPRRFPQHGAPRGEIRPGSRWADWLLLCALLFAGGTPAAAQGLNSWTRAAAADTSRVEQNLPLATEQFNRGLFLESIELAGTDRTPLSTVQMYLPLRPGQPIDQVTLIEGVEELRRSGLFRSVRYFTRPGSRRGFLVLVLEVEEQGFDFRFGTGNTDLDGWYVIPAMVALDNQFGRGGIFDLKWRIGFRHTGLLLTYAQPRSGDGRNYWGTRLYVLGTDRPYFSEGVEYRHAVDRVGVEGVFGRRYGERWTAEVGLHLEGVDVAETSTAHTTSGDGSVSIDDEVPYEDLPAEIQEATGEDFREIIHLDLQLDSRHKRLRAGTPTGGLWGRLKTQFTLQEHRSFIGLQGDLRAYREVPGGVFATRLRGSVVSEGAAFYDRLYLGGMYTVRGFPTHSLSAPGGDTWLWSGSVEYRSRILGRGDDTRLAGLLFLDGGASGRFGEDSFAGVSLGAGYGLRLKVIWLDWIGLDVGIPLTERPIDSRFQVNASIGWSF